MPRSRGTSRHKDHQLVVLVHVGLVGGQVLAELRVLLVQVLEDPLEPAVLGDELGGRLPPRPARRAGCRRGRRERGVLRVERRGHTGPILDPGLVVVGEVGDAAPHVQHPHVGVFDELVGVAIAGRTLTSSPASRPWGRERGDDVVRLEGPSLRASGSRNVSSTWRTKPICWRRMSGAESRVPLYVDSRSWRKVGSGKSNATAIESGFVSRRMFTSIDVKPNTALVT